jgi:outer membrane lipoprotein carrier protein
LRQVPQDKYFSPRLEEEKLMKETYHYIMAAIIIGIISFPIMVLAQDTSPPPANAPSTEILTLDQVIAKVQANYASIVTYSTDFEQELLSLSQGRVISKGAGTVIYKKPSHMVWTYRTPEEHLYITDGNTIWDYAPADKEAYILPMKDALYKSFLLGLGDLKKEFEVSFHSGAAKNQDGLYQLDLVPRDQAERDALGTITLYVDPKDFTVRITEMTDALANQNRITFKNIKLNPELDAKLFHFTPPPGVKVIKAQDLIPAQP